MRVGVGARRVSFARRRWWCWATAGSVQEFTVAWVCGTVAMVLMVRSVHAALPASSPWSLRRSQCSAARPAATDFWKGLGTAGKGTVPHTLAETAIRNVATYWSHRPAGHRRHVSAHTLPLQVRGRSRNQLEQGLACGVATRLPPTYTHRRRLHGAAAAISHDASLDAKKPTRQHAVPHC